MISSYINMSESETVIGNGVNLRMVHVKSSSKVFRFSFMKIFSHMVTNLYSPIETSGLELFSLSQH